MPSISISIRRGSVRPESIVVEAVYHYVGAGGMHDSCLVRLELDGSERRGSREVLLAAARALVDAAEGQTAAL